jgi:hypothetical protein
MEWALEPGPKIPVTKKSAYGYFSYKMLIRGIDPPSPIWRGSSPKKLIHYLFKTFSRFDDKGLAL